MSGLAADPIRGLTVRRAAPEDVPGIRAFMLQVFEQDYRYGYQPQWHWDYDDLQGVYLDNPRHTLFMVVDDASGGVVGTAGIRSGGPTSSSLPRWLVERYQPPSGPPRSSGCSSTRSIAGAALRGS